MRFLLLRQARGETEALQAAARRAPELVEVLSDPWTRLLVDASTPTLTVGEAGVVIGVLFHQASGERVTRLSSELAAEVAESGGAALSHLAWGSYVSVLRGPERRLAVVRDPSGSVPVYRLSTGGLEVLTSDLALIERGLGLRPGIDWAGVAQILAFPQVKGRATGLTGVTEMPAGAQLSWRPEGPSERQLWSPWTFAERARQIDDIDAARDQLRRTLERVVRLWGEVYPDGLLELSGGLDSSLVGLCLPRRGTISALNIVTEAMEGDERDYARLSAAAAGLPLAEALVRPAADFRRARPGRFPRPASHGYLQAIEAKIAEVGRDNQVQAFFSGKGGDNVLCDIHTAGPGADGLLTFGLGRRSFSILADLARVHGCTIWTAARLSVKKALRPSRPLPVQTQFLRLRAPPPRPDHPWLQVRKGVLPGKRDHLRSLLLAHAFLDRYAHAAEAPVIAPMLSQPMIELCLRIPTWMWIDGGQGRAIARQAFADRLPARVRQRTTKGRLDGFAAAVYRGARADLTDLLLNGRLARAGLIDGEALGRALLQDHHASAVLTRIFQLADTEAWARTWD